SDVGIAFARAGTPPPTRTLQYGSVESAAGTIARDVTLAGERTSVRDLPATPRPAGADPLPIEVIASEGARPLVDAAIAAVLAQRVWTPGGRARLVIAAAERRTPNAERGTPNRAPSTEHREPFVPWMANAIARMARDSDLQQAAARSTAAL